MLRTSVALKLGTDKIRCTCSKQPLEGILISLILPRADSLLPPQSSHQGFCESFPVVSPSLYLLETRCSASLVCPDAVIGISYQYVLNSCRSGGIKIYHSKRDSDFNKI